MRLTHNRIISFRYNLENPNKVKQCILTVDVLGCHCGLPPGPAIDIGGIPGDGPGPPGPAGPGPNVLLGGGPRMPGPYEPGPIGPMPGPLGGFIRGFIGLIPGGPVNQTETQHISEVTS